MNCEKVRSLRGNEVSPSVRIFEVDRLQEQLDLLRSRLFREFSEAADPATKRDCIEESPIDHYRLVREILRARRHREKIFGSLFGEPAWDILLELFAAEQVNQRISISGACYSSGVPPTTALRWISRLEKEGLLQKKADDLDGRRSWVVLTEKASAAMRDCLEKMAIQPT